MGTSTSNDIRGNWPRSTLTPEQRRQEIEARALRLAKQWGEPCHVYVLKGNDRGIVEYHPGPDPDRPRTEPDFVAVADYPKKGRTVKHE